MGRTTGWLYQQDPYAGVGARGASVIGSICYNLEALEYGAGNLAYHDDPD
jgi:hypothetical protein